MFGLFKSKTEIEKLQEKYLKLMKEAHALSKTNRRASDDKTAEAAEVVKKIDLLKLSWLTQAHLMAHLSTHSSSLTWLSTKAAHNHNQSDCKSEVKLIGITGGWIVPEPSWADLV